MKLKEGIGIGIGILFIAISILSLGILSKDDQKGRTVPVLQSSWEKANFENKLVQETVKDLDIKNLKGFLYQKDSQTPMYFAIYIGKSPKGADEIKKYFKGSAPYPEGYKAREESSMKILGSPAPVICSGKRDKDLEINYSGDHVIISYPPQSTNVVLDEIQKEHFIHRYFKKNVETNESANANADAKP